MVRRNKASYNDWFVQVMRTLWLVEDYVVSCSLSLNLQTKSLEISIYFMIRNRIKKWCYRLNLTRLYLTAGLRRLGLNNEVIQALSANSASLTIDLTVVSAPGPMRTLINRILLSRAFDVIKPEFPISNAKCVMPREPSKWNTQSWLEFG